MDIMITLPKVISWEEYLSGMKTDDRFNMFRLGMQKNPKQKIEGSKCYIVYDNYIRGYMIINGVEWCNFIKRKHTKRIWLAGYYIVTQRRFYETELVPVKSFRGYRYVNNMVIPKKKLSNEEFQKLIVPGTREIHNQDLSGRDLRSVDTKGIAIKYCTFINSDLSGCDMSNAEITECNFSYATMIDVNMDGSKIDAVTFNHANMQGSTMKKVIALQCSFREAIMKNVIAYHSTMHKCDLYFTDLTNANFAFNDMTGSVIDRATLENTNLTYTNLTLVSLERVDMSAAFMKESYRIVNDNREAVRV